MVRYTLCEAVKRMESMARIWRRHDPLVMRLVQSFVNARVVQSSVNPIDEEIGKEDEEWELKDIVQPKGGVGRRIVEFGVPSYFPNEKGNREDCHDGKGNRGLLDLEFDLVLEVFRVGEGGMVEDEDVRQASTDEVDDKTKEPEGRQVLLVAV